MLCAVLPCCSDSLAATTTEAGWQALGVPPHSTAQAAACRFVKESGAGGRWSRVRWSSAADAVSAPPPWCGVVVGRGHGQRTRRGDGGVPSSAQAGIVAEIGVKGTSRIWDR